MGGRERERVESKLSRIIFSFLKREK